jgi:hypothetical protein
MTEERVPRFSRGDLRRMRENIQEQEQPSIDGDLVQDVLGVKPNAPDFEVVRFAVNFRLAREHRDFEFVGTSHQRFWSTSGLAQIGTTRRKPNELGTDYRYLLDEAGEDVRPRSDTSIDHTPTCNVCCQRRCCRISARRCSPLSVRSPTPRTWSNCGIQHPIVAGSSWG